jgi:hypothetical protein
MFSFRITAYFEGHNTGRICYTFDQAFDFLFAVLEQGPICITVNYQEF